MSPCLSCGRPTANPHTCDDCEARAAARLAPPARGAVRCRSQFEREALMVLHFPDRIATEIPGVYEYHADPPAPGLTGAGWLRVRGLDVEWSQDDRLG